MNRLLNSSNKQKSNQNLLLYKKDSSPPISPRQPMNSEAHRQSTTYNYNYRDPYLNSSSSFENLTGLNQKITTTDPLRPPADYLSQNYMNKSNQNLHSIPQLPTINATLPNNFQLTSIEREAADRHNSKSLTKSNSFSNRPKAGVELNRISNKLYNDNQPTYDYPNNPYW